MRNRGRSWIARAIPQRILSLSLAAVVLVACITRVPPPPTATPDYAQLETLAARKLSVRRTAYVPLPTITPSPTETKLLLTATPLPSPTPTLTPTATPLPLKALLAFVRISDDGAANVVLMDESGKEEQLTHFVEPEGILDLNWSRDGNWLLLVSSHGYLYSRGNERNVLLLKADGSELRMITGEYVDPELAAPPYAVLRGSVTGGDGVCRVSAQGAVKPAQVDKDGRFSLPGVPTMARWARAVCEHAGGIWQGVVDLVPGWTDTDPVNISVEPQGQGWQQAVLAPDNTRFAGTLYRWRETSEGQREYAFQGAIGRYEEKSQELDFLELPEGATFHGLDWAPDGGRLVGALTTESGTALWLWTDRGKLDKKIWEMANPEDQILSAVRPRWSPDGSRIAFELRRWYWWGENKYRTDLMVISADGADWRSLELPWGQHIEHISWMSAGLGIFYELKEGDSGQTPSEARHVGIWAVAMDTLSQPIPWVQDPNVRLPAASPRVSMRPE